MGCEERVLLWDEMEQCFASPEIQQRVHDMQEECASDNGKKAVKQIVFDGRAVRRDERAGSPVHQPPLFPSASSAVAGADRGGRCTVRVRPHAATRRTA